MSIKVGNTRPKQRKGPPSGDQDVIRSMYIQMESLSGICSDIYHAGISVHIPSCQHWENGASERVPEHETASDCTL